ncbi:discoidin domain-containing protein [bacterium]|nr:discoidin domain-containing protein [bacterium]
MIWLKLSAGNDSTHRNRASLGKWELYGYEEDPPTGDHSVDTTFMSRFNNPQLTGVQVLVDGATEVGTNQISGGPDPSGNQSTYVTDGKYWTLNGTLTSNLAVEANTFLEGDQPHAVSVWFNSSNLEANVSNTCVFSVSDQEKLDSVNLDLQSNTWHNLTYAYQGEGGSRVTYLDGRKVAEDQAEDTFGDYPPFAMTGLSQGGYVLSTNGSITAGSTNASPHYAFDNQINNFFGFGRMDQTGTGTNQTGGPTMPGTVDGSTLPSGYWLKLELPHKLHVNSYNITPRGDLNQAASSPLTWKVYGSNDDSVWTLLHEKTDSTPINPQVSTTNNPGSTFAVSTIGSFKYLALIVLTNAGYTYLNLGELRYYGHRENDLVRLPDPTNVLKYPHIAMTGQPGTANGVSDIVHAQRGYVVTASSMYVDNSTNPFQPWRAFNNETGSSSNGTSWVSTGLTNTYGGVNNTYGTVRSANLGSDSGGTATENGEWLKVQLPHKIVLSHIQMVGNSADTSDHPKSFKLYGSINGTTWVEVISVTNTGSQDTSTGTTFTPGSTPDAYNYFGLVVTALQSRTNYITVTELKLYGTGVDSVPIQIGGGNIDKVANFRVYDKFIGEDQALEIWDAQKDAFGRAKSSMTLQKGRLGIGTTEPEGRLAVADEPHGLEEFPPRAMTGYETYFEGHGEFCASSGTKNTNNGEAYLAFNKTLFERGWHGGSETDAYYTNSIYQGSLTNGGYSGDWIRLDLPYKVKLTGSTLYHRDISQYVGRMPKKGVILGSNDNGKSWELVHSWDNEMYEFFKEKRFMVNSNSYFQSFILVIQELETTETSEPVNIGEWRLFGTREQGQSVLHDGQLTLTKSLTVPRIGPALDADDTPRRDRLVVEYNTSTNPTFEGAVRDTSGRGVDGIMHTATYNATEKAIESNGNTGTFNNGPGGSASGNLNDYGSFETILPSSLQGNPVFTVSGWFKQNTIADLQLMWLVGRNLRVTAQPGMSNKMHWFGITSTGSPRIALGGGGNLNLYYTDGSIKAGTWHHMVVVIEPTGTDITQNHVRFYLDGVHQTTSNTGSSGTIDLGDGAPPRMHWFWQEAADVYYNGSASSLKIHDVALTAEEVKTLYDMGRNGSVANPQPLHIAAPLYAPGTIVQVEQAVKTDVTTIGSTTGENIKGLSINIHPKFSTSKILVSYCLNVGGQGHGFVRIKRTQGGTTSYIGLGDVSGDLVATTSYFYKESTLNQRKGMETYYFEFLDSANGTSAITYDIMCWKKASVYAMHINKADNEDTASYYGRTSSSITAKEVCQ